MDDPDPPGKSEFELIDLIHRAAGDSGADVVLGIGDDAAAVAVDGSLLVTVDVMNEGVHFPPGLLTPRQMGARAVLGAASDIAAMGAAPRWMVIGLALPENISNEDTLGLCNGLIDACGAVGAVLVGGDLTRGALSISVTVLGVAPKRGAVKRSGARAGDLIYVGGTLGDACLGLGLLKGELRVTDADEAERLKQRFIAPAPQIELGGLLGQSGLAGSMIDVSDGLAQDLGHVAGASGVDIELSAASLPASSCLAEALPERSSRLEALVGWGEDFRLAFSVGREDASELERLASGLGEPLARIGEAVPMAGEHGVVRLLDEDGTPVDIERTGYRHF